MQIKDSTNLIGLFSDWISTYKFVESDIKHKKHSKCSMCLLRDDCALITLIMFIPF